MSSRTGIVYEAMKPRHYMLHAHKKVNKSLSCSVIFFTCRPSSPKNNLRKTCLRPQDSKKVSLFFPSPK